MSKFNRGTVTAPRGRGPVTVTETAPTRTTYEGAPAYSRTAKSDLFLLAVTNLAGEDTFYEAANDRDRRYRGLVRQVAVEDPIWLARMLRWLRGTANMRSAAVVGAAEMAHARLQAGAPSIPAYDVPGWTTDRGVERAVVDDVCQRGDEPGELLAYWIGTYGRPIPKPVKRGLADAAARLYTEYTLLKYDTGSRGVRFADVIELTRAKPRAAWQADLFRHAIERRHNRDEPLSEKLPMVAGNKAFRLLDEPGLWLDTERLKKAGMTWEDALSAVGSRVSKKALWEALIPTMGIMALARNLRNFDEAGVSDEVAAQVLARFADREQVLRSRMFPFRWLSAYEQAPSLRWGHALDQAATVATGNLPELPGRSLILVDTSSSMTSTLSARSKVTPVKAAALFGVAQALRGQADVYGFADGVFLHKVPAGASLLRTTTDLVKRVGEVGHGTRIAEALARTYRGHDRVFIFSDMQTMPFVDGYRTGCASYGIPRPDVVQAVPAAVPVYAFNLAGYAGSPIDLSRPGRVELGGLTDATFRMIPLIEAGQRADWPF